MIAVGFKLLHDKLRVDEILRAAHSYDVYLVFLHSWMLNFGMLMNGYGMVTDDLRITHIATAHRMSVAGWQFAGPFLII